MPGPSGIPLDCKAKAIPRRGAEAARLPAGERTDCPSPGPLGHEAPMNSPPAPTAAASSALQEALALHREGKHELAMQRYVAILQQNPGNVDALYYVAMLALQQGQFAEGLKVIAARARARARRRRGCTTSRARRICGRTRTTTRCKASAAPSRSIRRSPTPTATAARCCPRWAARRRRSPTSTARWRCGRTIPRTIATGRARWPISAVSTRRWQGFTRAIALMPEHGAGLFQPRRCAAAARPAGRSAARLRLGDRALSGDRRRRTASRGIALKALGRLDEALASLERALALQPGSRRGACQPRPCARRRWAAPTRPRRASSARPSSIRSSRALAERRTSAAPQAHPPPPASRRSDRRGAPGSPRRGPRTACSSPRRHAPRSMPRRW